MNILQHRIIYPVAVGTMLVSVFLSTSALAGTNNIGGIENNGAPGEVISAQAGDEDSNHIQEIGTNIIESMISYLFNAYYCQNYLGKSTYDVAVEHVYDSMNPFFEVLGTRNTFRKQLNTITKKFEEKYPKYKYDRGTYLSHRNGEGLNPYGAMLKCMDDINESQTKFDITMKRAMEDIVNLSSK